MKVILVIFIQHVNCERRLVLLLESYSELGVTDYNEIILFSFNSCFPHKPGAH